MNKAVVCLLLIFTVAIFAQNGAAGSKSKSHMPRKKITFRPPIPIVDQVPKENIDSTSEALTVSVDTANLKKGGDYVQGTAQELICPVEEIPEFPGGNDSLLQYLKCNVRYPGKAKVANIEGKVAVSFVVTKTGKIKKVKVIRGIGYGCDEEAVRVIKSMPKWKPGSSLRELRDVQFYVPVNFKLDSLQIVDTSASNRKAKPKFPGGMDAVKRYIYDHIQYPKNIGCIEGKMEVEFWINAEGVIESVFVTKKLQPYLSSEVVRVIKTLPRFIPAKQKGVNVSTKIILPLKFEIK